MKKLSLLICCIFIWNVYSAQVGKSFPVINGSTLDEKASVLPVKNGKFSVIAIAFHRDAETDLKKWLNPLFQTFIKDDKESSKGIDVADVYDVNFMFVPVIAGFKRFAEEFKKDTDARFWKYIMDTEKADMKGLQAALGITDNKIPYFFIVNAEGKIVAVESGKFLQSKIDKLEDAVE